MKTGRLTFSSVPLLPVPPGAAVAAAHHYCPNFSVKTPPPLAGSYRVPCRFWEAWVLLRKFCLKIIVIFVKDPILQGVFVCLQS